MTDWKDPARFAERVAAVRKALRPLEWMDGPISGPATTELIDVAVQLDELAGDLRRVVAEVLLEKPRATREQLLEEYNELRQGGGPLLSAQKHAEWTARWKGTEEALRAVNDVIAELEQLGGINQP